MLSRRKNMTVMTSVHYANKIIAEAASLNIAISIISDSALVSLKNLLRWLHTVCKNVENG